MDVSTNITPESSTDCNARELALNPQESYIVQAPAGSGKTSLLVQRYLTLLAEANAPEEIIAITFTRKAAAEMRNRILSSLKNATTDCAADKYTAKNAQLAQKVLRQSDKYNWDIEKNPQRFYIQTIDSLCHKICNAAPLLSDCNQSAKILEDLEAEDLYRRAARSILKIIFFKGDHHLLPALKTLFLHLHNDATRFEKLAIAMLQRREQWLAHIKIAEIKDRQSLRHDIESGLATLVKENIENCYNTLPKNLFDEICVLFDFASNNLRIQNSDSPIATSANCREKILAGDEKTWRGLIDLLLAKNYSWRNVVNKNQGFLSSTSDKNQRLNNSNREMKVRMLAVLAALKEHESFRLALRELAISPPGRYTESEWQIICALLELLPFLVKELKVIFDDRGVVDHAEIAIGALATLAKSNLLIEAALNLEYPIKHLLVDEFQDTSLAQYRLLEKLIEGWQNGNGKTLFLVGDPMQSIYRFREAEVGLFLHVQKKGIAAIKLINITLTTNFRSQKNIIAWVNSVFSKLMPVMPNISNGAVPFSPSVAAKQNSDLSFAQVKIIVDGDEQSEAEFLVDTIRQLLENKDAKETIAILVKARQHLISIIPALIQAKIPYQAIDLNPLGTSSAIQDLFSLTRALISLADRNAWLAILRAPWCGLKLNDIHAIATGKHPTVWENLLIFSELNLSGDGVKRLNKFVPIIAESLKSCYRQPWRDSIETIWLRLGGPACLTRNEFLENHATLYFELLEEQNTPNLSLLRRKINTLYASSSNLSEDCVKIMTIHKAKGLEFDHVYIPGLNRLVSHDKEQLLLWQERPRQHGGSDLLLAPLRAMGEDHYPIYNFLKHVEQSKERYELGRLLYVAATRAKKTLHLTGIATADDVVAAKTKLGKKGSFLELLAGSFADDWLMSFASTKLISKAKPQNNCQTLYRLASDWQIPDSEYPRILNKPELTICDKDFYSFQGDEAKTIGIVIHNIFEQLSKEKLPNISTYIVNNELYWRNLLLEFGMSLEKAIAHLPRIVLAIKKTLQDSRGRWILDFQHEAAASEYKVTFIDNGIEHLVIDRTFVDRKGVRWIIDYKTTAPDMDDDIINFLATERKLYQEQLEKYARAISVTESRPCYLGLYFPVCSLWTEWVYKN